MKQAAIYADKWMHRNHLFFKYHCLPSSLLPREHLWAADPVKLSRSTNKGFNSTMTTMGTSSESLGCYNPKEKESVSFANHFLVHTWWKNKGVLFRLGARSTSVGLKCSFIRSQSCGLFDAVKTDPGRRCGDGHGSSHSHPQRMVVLPTVPAFPYSGTYLKHQGHKDKLRFPC